MTSNDNRDPAELTDDTRTAMLNVLDATRHRHLGGMDVVCGERKPTELEEVACVGSTYEAREAAIRDMEQTYREALIGAGFPFEIAYEEDGQEEIAFYLTIGAGEVRYLAEGGGDYQYRLSYWQRDDCWYGETVSKDGRQDNFVERDVAAMTTVEQVVEHIRARIGEDTP